MIREFSEVFKSLGNRSIRGKVVGIKEDRFTVIFTDKDESTYIQVFNLNELGINVFENENDLIKKKGTRFIELAPPREILLKSASDCNGRHIYEGDIVKATSKQPLYQDVSGKVKKIYMLSSIGFENMIFIDVENSNGEVICKRALANMFIAPVRTMSY